MVPWPKLFQNLRTRCETQWLKEQFEISERRVFRAITLLCGTHRYPGQLRSDDVPLTKRMLQLAKERRRLGHRRTARFLHDEGWLTNGMQVCIACGVRKG